MSWSDTYLDRTPRTSRRDNTRREDDAAARTLARMTVDAGGSSEEQAEALREALQMLGLIKSPPPPRVRHWSGRPR